MRDIHAMEEGHVDLEEINALQEAQIEGLRAQNEVSSAENAELRKAALSVRMTVDLLTASNQSLENLVAELQRAKAEIEALNKDQQKRNAALSAMNREMEAFSYAVSHDLRSPLRSIHGFSEALIESAAGKLSVEENAWLAKISAAAMRMDRLTEDLLRLSRISRLELKREEVNLSMMAREIVHELRQSDPGRDVVFAISEGMKTVADPVLMRVALTNLLGNAWKYTGKRAQALVSFSQEHRDNQTIFCVSDNGAGFDMAYAAKLFAPFQRLHSTREFPGTGVGLACVARVIHKHEGRIWADAKTDQGATFYFILPVRPAPV